MRAWKDLARLPAAEVAALDLAEAHMACAAGLPDAPNGDEEKACLTTLADWARRVKGYTEATLPRWRKHPGAYALPSEEYFRLKCMADIFERLGVRFDPDAFGPGRHPETWGHCLCGLTATKRGTYATLPVLWAAVGRRLGYPIRLVRGRWRSGNSHVFARWDQPAGACLNIELTSRGLHCPATDHYRSSDDFFVPPEEEKRCCLLRPLKPKEELAYFLVQRGHSYMVACSTGRGVESFAWASALFPENVEYAGYMMRSLQQWHRELEQHKPFHWPEVWLDCPRRLFPDALPREVERDFLHLEVTERLLEERRAQNRWWEPALPGRPERAVGRFDEDGLRRVEVGGAALPVPPGAVRAERPSFRYPPWSPPPQPPTPPPITISPLTSGLPRSRVREAGLHWRDVVELTEGELAALGIEAVHFACVADLPGSQAIPIRACLEKVRALADAVREYTEKQLPKFRRAPERFNNSEGYFRALCLITHLQRDRGVRYNRAKAPHDVPLEMADRFLHSVLFGEGGICATLPVLYAAVGRRLGYPIKLVSAKAGEVGHLFARWDGPDEERFNIEATGPGLSCLPDEYYRTGRYAITPEQEEAGQLLMSKTPRMELAGFMAERGFCWLDIGRHREAVESFVWAYVLCPQNRGMWNTLARTETAWREGLVRRTPKSFPLIRLHHDRRWPEAFGIEFQSGVMIVEATEALLDNAWCEEHWWGPLRRGEEARVPSCIHAHFDAAGRGRIEFEFGAST
jgi:hypothetical protein